MAGQKYPLQSLKPMRAQLFALFILVTTTCSSAFAVDQDLGTLLTARYGGQILALRHSFTARSQEYDSQGNSLSGGSEGAWTVFGRIDVTKLSVAADHMQVEGDQVVFGANRGGSLKPSRQHERVNINIRLDHALDSEDEAVAILGRVFALSPEDVVESAPILWRAYLAKQLKVRPSAKATDPGTANQEKSRDVAQSEITTEDGGQGKIFRLGKDITPPKPIATPEPEFTPWARKQRFEGQLTLDVVLDSAGKVSSIAVVRPLGMGLDEAAAAKVSTWRFTPGMHEGHPVAVAFYIEVEFHLYDRP